MRRFRRTPDIGAKVLTLGVVRLLLYYFLVVADIYALAMVGNYALTIEIIENRGAEFGIGSIHRMDG